MAEQKTVFPSRSRWHITHRCHKKIFPLEIIKKLVAKELDTIISIIKNINPEKIYLFGSHATRSFDEESDIDLFIVAPSDKTPLERRLMLRRMLLEYNRSIGLNLLVYTPDEFDMLRKESSSFISSAIRKGTKIYERETS